MTEILALEHLYHSVRAYFAAQAWECFQPFGWRETAQQQTARNRIVWVPGDRSGYVGSMIGPTQPGGVPRYLATIKETFYVVISTWADDNKPENELLQWRSTRKLFDQWFTAVIHTAQGTFDIVRPEWIQLHKERRSGTALAVTVTIQSPIADQTNEAITAPPPVRGVVDVIELDVTEQVITGPPPITVAACSVGSIVLADEQEVDGVLCLEGARVLVNHQADSRANGLYEVVLGGAWARTADVLVQGLFVQVLPGGDLNGDTGYQLITSDPVVFGASPIVFELVGPIRTQTP